MKIMSVLSLLCVVCLSTVQAQPLAPRGFKWELIPELSDEFNGDALDKEKWLEGEDTQQFFTVKCLGVKRQALFAVQFQNQRHVRR